MARTLLKPRLLLTFLGIPWFAALFWHFPSLLRVVLCVQVALAFFGMSSFLIATHVIQQLRARLLQMSVAQFAPGTVDLLSRPLYELLVDLNAYMLEEDVDGPPPSRQGPQQDPGGDEPVADPIGDPLDPSLALYFMFCRTLFIFTLAVTKYMCDVFYDAVVRIAGCVMRGMMHRMASPQRRLPLRVPPDVARCTAKVIAFALHGLPGGGAPAGAEVASPAQKAAGWKQEPVRVAPVSASSARVVPNANAVVAPDEALHLWDREQQLDERPPSPTRTVARLAQEAGSTVTPDEKLRFWGREQNPAPYAPPLKCSGARAGDSAAASQRPEVDRPTQWRSRAPRSAPHPEAPKMVDEDCEQPVPIHG